MTAQLLADQSSTNYDGVNQVNSKFQIQNRHPLDLLPAASET